MREYRHIFVDSTSDSRLSVKSISTGVGGTGESGGEIKSGSAVVTSVKDQLKSDIGATYLDQPLNAVTGGLWSPAKQAIKQFRDGAEVAAIAGAGAAVAFKLAELGINALIQRHEERIAQLESDAREANNADNLLIKAGRLNITNATINYDKYGKATYKYDKS